MAQIIIDVPDANALRILNGICGKYNYDGVNTTPAKLAFVKSKMIAWMKEGVTDYEGSVAARTAVQTTATEITNISIT
jgi:hypothetical protein